MARGVNWICDIEAGDEWTLFNGKVIVCNPAAGSAPKVIDLETGRVEKIHVDMSKPQKPVYVDMRDIWKRKTP